LLLQKLANNSHGYLDVHKFHLWNLYG